jgi:hypothetical protein
MRRGKSDCESRYKSADTFSASIAAEPQTSKYGRYIIVDPAIGGVVAGHEPFPYSYDLDQVEVWLKESGKRSTEQRDQSRTCGVMPPGLTPPMGCGSAKAIAASNQDEFCTADVTAYGAAPQFCQ